MGLCVGGRTRLVARLLEVQRLLVCHAEVFDHHGVLLALVRRRRRSLEPEEEGLSAGSETRASRAPPPHAPLPATAPLPARACASPSWLRPRVRRAPHYPFLPKLLTRTPQQRAGQPLLHAAHDLASRRKLRLRLPRRRLRLGRARLGAPAARRLLRRRRRRLARLLCSRWLRRRRRRQRRRRRRGLHPTRGDTREGANVRTHQAQNRRGCWGARARGERARGRAHATTAAAAAAAALRPGGPGAAL